MVNYQKELEKILQTAEQKKEKPFRLYLHSCCAPCSSYVLEYLSAFFEITVFFFNPNISFEEEYHKRVEEQKRLIEALNRKQEVYPIRMEEGDYDPEMFYQAVKGLEQCPEGGERCAVCFEQRLAETARRAAVGGYDFFATTLTISPLKNAQKINEIGMQVAERYKAAWLPSDFKKKNGYKRSVELSEEYNLYRQDYCGCAYSKAERDSQKKLANLN